MRSILLVRHGKASAFLSTGDYDELSPLGVEQSERLGAALAEHGVAPRAVFVGPRQRHLQSYEAAARTFASERSTCRPRSWSASSTSTTVSP